MRPTILALAVSLALAPHAYAQSSLPPPPSTEVSIPLSYVAANARVGLGINDNGDIHGEARGFFGDNGNSLWFGEGWLQDGSAGGIKFGRHWLWGDSTRQDTIDNPDSVTVAKSFIAVDQNAYQDRKVSLGIGMERENWFGDVYLSGGITGKRLVNQSTSSVTTLITGTSGGQPYQQTQTVETLLREFEHPYEAGIGARIGRFLEPALLRLTGGLDYEKGEYDSNQITVSGGLEKFFNNSGHSLALNLEHLNKSGDFETQNDDTRAWLTWRYEFGKRSSFRVREPYRMVENSRTVTLDEPGETVVVKNEIRMDANAFFGLDQSRLTAEGEAALASVLDAIKAGKRVSRISVIGHTCDLGSDAYNQALSERRAVQVRDWFAVHGVEIAEIDISGQGESNPRYPNDADNREKNRRVDVSFLTLEEKSETSAPVQNSESIVEWVKEPVAAPAAWIERAMRNPAEHKRSVDVYRFQTTETTTTLGPQVFLNGVPVAQNDNASTSRDNPVVINVLNNDSDPDGDPLSITALGAASHGTASLVGNAVNYSPLAGFVGTDSFTYTISDGQQGSASATVTVVVSESPPIANPDNATTSSAIPVLINVLANDSDPQGDALSVAAVSNPAHGIATIDSNGMVIYTSAPDFVGTDTFTYTLRDSTGSTAEGVVTVLVNGGNRPPVAVDDSYEMLAGNTLILRLLDNDSDPDGDAITLVSYSQPANGIVYSYYPGGALYYRNYIGFCGIDTLTYTIQDAYGLTATATVSINVLD